MCCCFLAGPKLSFGKLAPSTLLWATAAAVALIAALPQLAVVRYHTHAVTTGSGAILVTGASSGIGRHAAEALARRGWVVFAGVRSAASADSIRAVGIEGLIPLLIDVTSAASRAAAVAEVADALRERNVPFVALVNNAGVARVGLPLEFEPEATTREVMETNFFGALGTTQAFLPLLRTSKGRIVMISSISGVVAPQPTWGSYAASKFALEAASDALRRELAPAGVSVSVIEPAFVKTAIATTARSRAESHPAALLAASRAVYPWVRDMAGEVEFGVERGDSPQVTTDVIVHAIESPTPRTRYVVASIVDGATRAPAAVIVWLEWLLPDRLMDIVINKK